MHAAPLQTGYGLNVVLQEGVPVPTKVFDEPGEIGVVAEHLEVPPLAFENRPRPRESELRQVGSDNSALRGPPGTEAFRHHPLLDSLEQPSGLNYPRDADASVIRRR